jgi:hypothetical protein
VVTDRLKVDFNWLYDLQHELTSIDARFSEVDDKRDFSLQVFGDQRVIDALGDFTDHWSDGRDRIRSGIDSLAQTIGQTAHNYEQVDVDLAKAAAGSGGGQATTNGGASTSGGAGATRSGRVAPPPAPTPRPGSVAWSATGSLPLGPDPAPGTGALAVGFPAGWLRATGSMPSKAGDDPIRNPASVASAGGAEVVGDRSAGADIRAVAADLRRHAAQVADPTERTWLMGRAEALDREAADVESLAGRPDMLRLDPPSGVYVGLLGSGQPSRVVVVVGEPGGASTFAGATLPHAEQLVSELERRGASGVVCVPWQDYSTASGGPADPRLAVGQGAANLGAFVDAVRRHTGLGAGDVCVVGHGLGASVADHALAVGALGGSAAVTPATLGLPAAGTSGPPPVRLDAAVNGDPASSDMSHSGHGTSPMMGVMALGSLSQGLFFRGRSLERVAGVASGESPEVPTVSAW